ncbi:XRE family transcriptional regulator [Hymenobacter aquaticus]|uniref:XRE family transcriptional regulator n=1 Tax=Hymenobacter aquaticus TaxID=1867101 RepID=A0A4Z0PS46_9BACT|nr:helix-turn-helix transcriptional regulator [Hymenobacter aquaticus]TGE20547.1 XRE family transcriptional regulator [Hymenobacter aquaticus]
MPQLPLLSNTVSARVRAHFCLTQAELGRFLGVTPAQVSNVEAGRSVFSEAVQERLFQLRRWLPQEAAPAPEAPAPEPPEAGPLQQRLRRCRHLAAGARYELEEMRRRTQAHAARQQALARLRQVLLTPHDPASPIPPDPAADPAHNRRWLTHLETNTAVAPAPPTAAEVALLEVRLAALEYEAGELEKRLPAPDSVPE